MAFTVNSAARLPLLPPTRARPLTTLQTSRNAADRPVAPPNRAFDTGLRPRPFPDETASLLPGLLAATRTGLPPASDDELTNTKIHHGLTSRCHLLLCWAHESSRLDRPRLFENRLCYRLLNVDPGTGDPRQVTINLTLGGMCYFDMIDVGEALAHEAALAAIDQRGSVRPDQVSWQRLPFRRLLRDPFALPQYPLMISVSTLTVRKSAAGATFYLLRRNPKKVAIAGGMLSVFPTGVFQPASVVPASESPDFDLWRNVMREYSEEYLGNPEHDGDGPPIDYEHTEPFRSLDAARRAGKIRISCLGIGIDALNYVGDVITVAVFDADVFDDIFDGMVTENDEGDLASDLDTQQFNFNEQTVQRLLANEPFAPSGAACLHLALKYRALVV